MKSMNSKKTPTLKPIISVTEMTANLNLSRARFYQLLGQGIFPQPIYDLRTHRPMYDAKLQMVCLEPRWYCLWWLQIAEQITDPKKPT